MKECENMPLFDRDALLREDAAVYRDGRYTLGLENGRPYLTAAGKRYLLSCHPYEPCLYITDENGFLTAVHNAFDPVCALEAFAGGHPVTSITGRTYDAPDFCRMVEIAAGQGSIGIDEAERAFGSPQTEKKPQIPAAEKEALQKTPENADAPEGASDVRLVRYPGAVIDYCLVKIDSPCRGEASHRQALACAFRALDASDTDGLPWRYDVRKACARRVGAEALFAPGDSGETLTYRKAFLEPPHGIGYTDADFRRVNETLFPNGTDRLDVMEWSTDWSDYFDDGREWWGAMCCTVYDSTLDRFTVILASATD